jgi:hypothetical protein
MKNMYAMEILLQIAPDPLHDSSEGPEEIFILRLQAS